MRYVLHLMCGEDEASETVVFESDNTGNVNLGTLTKCALFFVLDFLEDAKKKDPKGLYLPIQRKPSESGDEYWVLRDGFFELRPVFRDEVQRLYDMNVDRRVKPCSKV
ncbi:MAG: hypothetical protein NTV39_04525 [Candidatus Saccharibacteria bacterium]|nr:hypothetical protein [Candidatus Saccharibacteria bacterium]